MDAVMQQSTSQDTPKTPPGKSRKSPGKSPKSPGKSPGKSLKKKKRRREKALSKVRNWTKDEVELFTSVLADPDKEYLKTIQEKALKKQANAEVFKEIREHFDEALSDYNFIELNEKNFTGKGGKQIPHEDLDTDIPKLQEKYRNLKVN